MWSQELYGKIGFPNADEIETLKSQNANEIETLKSQYDSFVIKGRLRPKNEAFFRDNFAAKFYSQSLSMKTDCKPSYGEFVVFDTKRIKIRYMIIVNLRLKIWKGYLISANKSIVFVSEQRGLCPLV